MPGDEWKKKIIITIAKKPDINKTTKMFAIVKVWSSPGSAKQNRNP